MSVEYFIWNISICFVFLKYFKAKKTEIKHQKKHKFLFVLFEANKQFKLWYFSLDVIKSWYFTCICDIFTYPSTTYLFWGYPVERSRWRYNDNLVNTIVSKKTGSQDFSLVDCDILTFKSTGFCMFGVDQLKGVGQCMKFYWHIAHVGIGQSIMELHQWKLNMYDVGTRPMEAVMIIVAEPNSTSLMMLESTPEWQSHLRGSVACYFSMPRTRRTIGFCNWKNVFHGYVIGASTIN